MNQSPVQPACTPATRGLSLETLRTALLDVLVIGGGINGAGIARDLALRARQAGKSLRVGLAEQRQFGSGTSGRNSQLIHGGLRYLKQLRFRLVRESLRERGILLGLAPHLVEPLRFLMPFEGLLERLYYGAGLWLYDTLAGRQRIARHRVLNAEGVRRLEPSLGGGRAVRAAVFHDARVHAARFVLANVFDAVRFGAAAANYVRASGWDRQGEGFRVALEDTLSGERFEARARKLVDATGPWSREGTLRLVRGSHVVLPRVNASDHAIAHFDEAGRIVFLIPWGSTRQLTLVGTTDVDHENGPQHVRVSSEEVRYLLAVVRKLFPLASCEPVAAYSALRPLLRDESKSPTAASREHRIWNSGGGVLHIAGGKYTTYRAMSEEAADVVTREIAPALSRVHATAAKPLEGNTRALVEEHRRQAPGMAERLGIPEADALYVVNHYGIQAPALFDCLPAAAPAGLTRVQAAVAAFAVRHEMAQRLPDLLFLSTYWGYENRLNDAVLRPWAREMGGQRGWEPARIEEEIRLVLDMVEVPELP